MTKEQEDAIRILEAQASTKVKENHYLIFHKEATVTVLNMLKEKDRQIDFYKKGLEREIESNRDNIMEIIKKDKIIDLMTKQLAGLTIWNNEKEEPLILADKEEVIKYFEKKRQNVAERKSEEWKLK